MIEENRFPVKKNNNPGLFDRGYRIITIHTFQAAASGFKIARSQDGFL
jgi:hypothetical protein